MMRKTPQGRFTWDAGFAGGWVSIPTIFGYSNSNSVDCRIRDTRFLKSLYS